MATQPEALRMADSISPSSRRKCFQDLLDRAAELRRLHAERTAADGVINDLKPVAWTPVAEALPNSGVKVLACYLNRLGNLRRIRAMWTAAKTEEADSDDAEACSEYDEGTDTYYVTEGWYECIDNWGDYSSIAVTEGEVTHWMPLPPDPSTAPPQRPAKPVQEPVAWRYECQGRWVYVDKDPNLWLEKPEGEVQCLYAQQTTDFLSEEKNGAKLTHDINTASK